MIDDLNILKKILKDIQILSDEKWTIYGTGNGAKLVYRVIDELSLTDRIYCIIDSDEEVFSGKEFQGFPVRKLGKTKDFLDGIIIAAM